MSIEILKKYGIKAKKALGQNFLVNEEIVENISNKIEVKGKNIVEVGPGYGALTEKLIEKKPKSLNLVELDKDMIEVLEKRVVAGDFDLDKVEFKINNIDVLKFEPEQENYSVIANIPYYITSPILRHFLYDVKNIPEKMLILMQKDVGDKICRGTPCGYPNDCFSISRDFKDLVGYPQGVPLQNKIKSSVLSLFIAKKCFVKEVLFVTKENFVPAPKVESSVLLFENHDLYNDIDDEKFLKIIKIGFTNPRKKLIKNLENLGKNKDYILRVFDDLSLENNIRGEDLDIAKWCQLIQEIDI